MCLIFTITKERDTMKTNLLIIALLFAFISFSYSQVEISTALSNEIKNAIENKTTVEALVVLKDQVDILELDKQLYEKNASIKERTYTVITTLQDKSNSTQGSIVSYIDSKSTTDVIKYERYWIINAILIETKPEILLSISERNDIGYMDIDHKSIPDPTYDERPAVVQSIETTERGLKAVNAHKLWEMGYTGAGRLVMSRDTGVDGNHSALASRWRGLHVPWNQAWRGSGTFPNDGGSTGHGTHTMGTITGLNTANQDTIGIAFDAEWMACDFNYPSITAFQWAMDPDNNPATTDDMPDVISNSWGITNSTGVCYQATYASTYNAVEAVGIAIVFSSGNDGPGSQTITAPKNINTNLVNSWATGNINGNNPSYPISNSSGRGPSACGGSGSLLIKPEAVAPGSNVRSSIPGNNYGYKSGTSMACPHVSGVVALLKQAFPNKTGYEIKLALYYTAKETISDLAANDPGEPAGSNSGEDHTFGMGLIDAFTAYEYLLGVPDQPVDFTAFSDYATPNSMQLNWKNPTNLLNGDTLTTGSYQIVIERDNAVIDSVSGGVEQYTDNGLIDGTEYQYSIYAKIDSNMLESHKTETSWTAGGSPIPSGVNNLSISGGPDLIKLTWLNPSRNIDGTLMDDFNQINLYQDSMLVTSFSRSTVDTGRLDSAQYSPGSSGIYYWFITVDDNETGTNESVPSNKVRTPLNTPIVDKFADDDSPDPILWHTINVVVDDRADNPPSGPFSLNINATPFGGDVVELYPTDISGLLGTGLVFSYFYQPQGTGNEPPEENDSLQIFFKDEQDNWNLIKSYPGDTLYAFRQEIIDLDSLANIGQNYFLTNFQIRILSLGNAHPIWPRDEWFVDNIFLGEPLPIISTDSDTVLFDTTVVGYSDTLILEVQNIGLQGFTVSDILTPGSTFMVNNTNFTLAPGTNEKVDLIFTSQTAGNFMAKLQIIHDIPGSDTLDVYAFGSSIPFSTILKSDQVPKVFSLSQNYPNPFNPETTIEFSLPKALFVNLAVYSILGQKVATLVNNKLESGVYNYKWNATDFASGLYYYKIEAGDFSDVKKCLIIK